MPLEQAMQAMESVLEETLRANLTMQRQLSQLIEPTDARDHMRDHVRDHVRDRASVHAFERGVVDGAVSSRCHAVLGSPQTSASVVQASPRLKSPLYSTNPFDD